MCFSQDQNEIPNSPLAVVDDIISISSMESVRSYNEVESNTESTSSGYVTGTCSSITDEVRFNLDFKTTC